MMKTHAVKATVILLLLLLICPLPFSESEEDPGDTWICLLCGAENQDSVCHTCGKIQGVWYCEGCGNKYGDEEATELVTDEDLVIGKYREADACLENYSSLGLESAAGSKRGAALLASYDYTLVGEPEQKGDQALQTVRLRYLDLNALEEELNTPLAVFEGEEGEEDRIVYPTLSELLEKPEKYYTFVELQVQLHYSEGQWRIVADENLLSALAGGK